MPNVAKSIGVVEKEVSLELLINYTRLQYEGFKDEYFNSRR